MTNKVTITELANLLATTEEALLKRVERGELGHEIVGTNGDQTVLIPLTDVNLNMLRRAYGTGGKKILVSISPDNVEAMQDYVPMGRGNGQSRAMFELSLELLLSLLSSNGDGDVAKRIALFSQICNQPIALDDLAQNLHKAAREVESLDWQLQPELSN